MKTYTVTLSNGTTPVEHMTLSELRSLEITGWFSRSDFFHNSDSDIGWDVDGEIVARATEEV